MADEKEKKVTALAHVLRVGDSQITSMEQLDAALDDTVGRGSSLLDGLSVYRQGKEDYFKVGEEKKGHVTGIFLLSRRPTRACWEKDEITGVAPNCYSFDGVVPHSSVKKPYASKCDGCPFDKPGSGKGNQRKCKQKASDFILLVPDNFRRTDENTHAFIDPKDIIGPGLVTYSVGNRGSSRAYQEWLRSCKEKGIRPQGCVTRWKFGSDKSKSGVDYNYVEQEFVLPLPSPEEDPDIWEVIVKAVMDLKNGSADNILLALTGIGGGEEAGSDD